MDNKRAHILPCNCKKKVECPMDRRCNSKNAVYQASIKIMKIGYTLETGNKDCIIIDIPSLIHYLGIKFAYQNIFED